MAVAEMVDLACDMKSYDYFHSDDPVEAAKFVVSDAAAALWESVLRCDGFAAFARCVPEQFIRREADHGWTRRGYGQVPEKETALCVPLARLLTTPDMWRRFTESYLEALDAAGRADPGRPRTVYGSFDETGHRRHERTKDLAPWHGMLLDRGSPSAAVTSPGPPGWSPSACRNCPVIRDTWTSLWKSARNCLRAPASCYPSAP
jgi:hypothetical protein